MFIPLSISKKHLAVCALVLIYLYLCIVKARANVDNVRASLKNKTKQINKFEEKNPLHKATLYGRISNQSDVSESLFSIYTKT